MGWFSSGRSRRAPPPRSDGLSGGGDGGAPPPPAAVGGAPAAFPGDAGAPPRALTDEERAELAGRWMREQLLRRREEFTDALPLRVVAGTWNVNGRGPPADLAPTALAPWLAPHGGGADVVVAGFQEVVPLTATNVALASNTSNSDLWDERLDAMLNAGAGDERAYVQLVAETMVGVHLAVWVRASLASHVEGLNAAVVGTGAMGFMGNKGAVVARFKLHDSSFVFVNTHLSSGQSSTAHAKRNADVAEILRRCPSIDGHDVQVWLGDLNYRFAPDAADIAEITQLITAGDWSALRGFDELSREIGAGRVFTGGWREGPIAFPPTYKYRRGTNSYALGLEGECATGPEVHDGNNKDGASGARSSDSGGESGNDAAKAAALEKEKVRRPAWCDRILVRTRARAGTLERVDVVAYDAVGALCCSDHKPVTAVLSVEARRVDAERLGGVRMEVRRQLDLIEMETLPKCEMRNAIVELGEVRYGTRVDAEVTLTNVGQVPATWDILTTAHGDTCAPELPPWLSFEPASGTVMPGEEETIKISVFVQGRDGGAAALHAAGDALDAILVLRTRRGRDFFIPVSGTFAPGCGFGLILDDMAAVRPGSSGEYGVPRAIEVLIARLCDPDATAMRGLFSLGWEEASEQGYEDVSLSEAQLASNSFERANAHAVDPIRRMLETDSGELPVGLNPQANAAALLSLLASIPFAPLPDVVLADAGAAHTVPVRDHAIEALGRRCSPPVVATMECLTSFLRHLLAHASESRVSAQSLCAVFGELLFRPQTADGTVAARAFMRSLLEGLAPSPDTGMGNYEATMWEAAYRNSLDTAGVEFPAPVRPSVPTDQDGARADDVLPGAAEAEAKEAEVTAAREAEAPEVGSGAGAEETHPDTGASDSSVIQHSSLPDASSDEHEGDDTGSKERDLPETSGEVLAGASDSDACTFTDRGSGEDGFGEVDGAMRDAPSIGGPGVDEADVDLTEAAAMSQAGEGNAASEQGHPSVGGTPGHASADILDEADLC